MSSVPPAVRAEQMMRNVLQTQWDGVRTVILDSPPGAGKTGIVEALAAQAAGLSGQRCMVVTQTNEQAFELARRMTRNFPKVATTLFLAQARTPPDDLVRNQLLTIARASGEIPHGPSVVISNSARWSWTDERLAGRFDLMVVDEAYQLPDHRFHQIAGFADRLVLVGDPGQIRPVIKVNVERWEADPAGPHVAAPRALLSRHPDIKVLQLPVSRRLVPDTVKLVQPAFYPTVPFEALAVPGEHRVVFGARATERIDQVLDGFAGGASVALLELPSKVVGEVDLELVATIVRLIERLLTRNTQIIEGGTTSRLVPDMIGVVCANVSQVAAIQEALPSQHRSVLVETADRFQGLERAIMIVYHPLSGRGTLTEFQLDPGRLCVMLSRHRVACLVVTRAGLEDDLHSYAARGDRILGIPGDPEFEGWKSHLHILQAIVFRSGV